jgi:nitrite reductase/ring-hydroxylating ferredoxin subunit
MLKELDYKELDYIVSVYEPDEIAEALKNILMAQKEQSVKTVELDALVMLHNDSITFMTNNCEHKNGWYHTVKFGIFSKRIFVCTDCNEMHYAKDMEAI